MKIILSVITILFSITILLSNVSANIICNDGTTSPTCEDCHRGCCSRHGGCDDEDDYYFTDTNNNNYDENNDLIDNYNNDYDNENKKSIRQKKQKKRFPFLVEDVALIGIFLLSIFCYFSNKNN